MSASYQLSRLTVFQRCVCLQLEVITTKGPLVLIGEHLAEKPNNVLKWSQNRKRREKPRGAAFFKCFGSYKNTEITRRVFGQLPPFSPWSRQFAVKHSKVTSLFLRTTACQQRHGPTQQKQLPQITTAYMFSGVTIMTSLRKPRPLRPAPIRLVATGLMISLSDWHLQVCDLFLG